MSVPPNEDHAEPTQPINNAVKPSEHTDQDKPKGGIVIKGELLLRRLSCFEKVLFFNFVS